MISWLLQVDLSCYKSGDQRQLLHIGPFEAWSSKADKDLIFTSPCYVDIYVLQQQKLLFYVSLLDSEHMSIKEGVCALTVLSP